ncbi:MAG: RNA-binding protein [Candidatus Krumholzibacteriota bacterium]|nr:RNA-binding protein [Candidatus Krumholzibacteriota bacterium]
MRIYVGNLAYSVSEADLRTAFEPFGTIDDVSIVKDKYTDESKGFGFVEMSNGEEAQKAIDGLNGKELSGRTLTVNQARPRGEGRRGGGGGGGGGFGGGGGGGFRGGNRGGGGGGGGGRPRGF